MRKDNYQEKSSVFLSEKDREDMSQVCSLMIRHGVNEDVASDIVFKDHIPPDMIRQSILNGLAKQDHAERTGGSFRLEAGYIIAAINKAKKEGHIIRPSKNSRDMTARIKRLNHEFKPLPTADFEKRKQKQIAAINSM